MPGPVDLTEFVEGFVLEAEEHLGGATTRLLEVEEAARAGKAAPRAVRELFRALHTMKGLAAMVGTQPIVDLAHEMETLLRAADRGGGWLGADAIDALMQGLRAVEERVRALAQGQPVPPAPPKVLEALWNAQPRRGQGAPPAGGAASLGNLTASERQQLEDALQSGRRAVRVRFVPDSEKAARGVNITSVRERLSALGELVKVVPIADANAPAGLAFSLLLATDAPDSALAEAASAGVEALEPVAAAAPERAGEVEAGAPLPEELSGPLHGFVRVPVSRLDEALEHLSSLVVTRFRIARALDRLTSAGADTRELAAILGENARQLRELRSAIMQSRLVSVGEMLQRVPLIIRGLTRGAGKAVDLQISTGTAELDKSVAERLFPGIVHLVRNAVDHGLETREERARAGKPETGRLELRAENAAGAHLTLTVEDDGRGIDREAVARRAGRPVPESDAELLSLICLPGLSTRERATEASGRGMGMDVVRRTIEQLGGTLALKTSPGRGTRFTLDVPVSITIVDALGFACGDQVYVAPMAMVEEIMEVDASQVVAAPAVGDGGAGAVLLQRRGQPTPLVALDALLSGRPRGALPPKALLLRLKGQPVALGIDRTMGRQEVVVRPLEDPLVRVRGVSGAADLGDGRATLVLDLAALGGLLLREARE